MNFEWNEQKSRANSAKHGIDFETATQLRNDADEFFLRFIQHFLTKIEVL